eukprot:COSAG02_NODE_302_length_25234_cov_43.365307_14_plen_804_part_00
MAAPGRGDVLGTMDWLAALSGATELSSDEEEFAPDFRAGWDEDEGDELAEMEWGTADSDGEEHHQGSPAAATAATARADLSPPAASPTAPELLRNGEPPNFDTTHGYISDDGDDDEDGNADVWLPAVLQDAVDTGHMESELAEAVLRQVSAADATPAADESTTKTFVIKDLTVGKVSQFGTLKYFLAQRSLSIVGRKPELATRLAEAVGADRFDAAVPAEAASEDAATWVELTGVATGKEARLNQNGGAAPTNLDGRPEVPKKEFLIGDGEAIKRPTCKSKQNGKSPPKQGGPSVAMKLKPTSEPIEYYDLLLPPGTREKLFVKPTNMRAAMEGAGKTDGRSRKNYMDFTPFDLAEVDAIHGLYIINGLSPAPELHRHLKSPVEDPLYGKSAFKLRFPKGERRLRHFKRFLTLYDPRTDPQSATAKGVMFKVEPLLTAVSSTCRKYWRTGEVVSVDEQTVGFQGRHFAKQRITYKREGDGFQCDAVCDNGYTFAFIFRQETAPPSGLGLSPLHERVMYLLKTLPNDWTRIFMDNLYNSVKFCRAAYTIKCLTHGVARTWGRGIPDSVLQSEEKNLDKQDSVRGMVKAAILKDDPVAPDIVAASVYDTKPVHFVSSVVDKIEWLTKERKVYDKDSQEYKEIEYLRLNLIEWYNAGMGGVDIADQLRNQYRPDHWMRKRKWWWAIYMWALGVVNTNAFLLYKSVQQRAGKTKTMLSHHAFLERLAFQLIWPDKYIPGRVQPTTGTRTVYTGKNARAKQRKLDSKPKSVAVLTQKTFESGFPQRLDGCGYSYLLYPYFSMGGWGGS